MSHRFRPVEIDACLTTVQAAPAAAASGVGSVTRPTTAMPATRSRYSRTVSLTRPAALAGHERDVLPGVRREHGRVDGLRHAERGSVDLGAKRSRRGDECRVELRHHPAGVQLPLGKQHAGLRAAIGARRSRGVSRNVEQSTMRVAPSPTVSQRPPPSAMTFNGPTASGATTGTGPSASAWTRAGGSARNCIAHQSELARRCCEQPDVVAVETHRPRPERLAEPRVGVPACICRSRALRTSGSAARLRISPPRPRRSISRRDLRPSAVIDTTLWDADSSSTTAMAARSPDACRPPP